VYEQLQRWLVREPTASRATRRALSGGDCSGRGRVAVAAGREVPPATAQDI
jgi:hypothetical protein